MTFVGAPAPCLHAAVWVDCVTDQNKISTEVRDYFVSNDESANFKSILFIDRNNAKVAEASNIPDCFQDLNLDQIVDSITVGREEYELKPLFATLLPDTAAVEYRHEVIKDLQNQRLVKALNLFSNQMSTLHGFLRSAATTPYKQSKQRWFIDAVHLYTEAVLQLRIALQQATPVSKALSAFALALSYYTESKLFQTLVQGARAVKAELMAVRYSLHIKDSTYTVRTYEKEVDYTSEIEQTFAIFEPSNDSDNFCELPKSSGMGHIEATILEAVARLNPKPFEALERFCSSHERFVLRGLHVFEREIQFYLAYLEMVERLTGSGLKFCIPTVANASESITTRGAFDISLALKLAEQGKQPICNDFHVQGQERVMVVTGPNQGGKTTFARMFGQMHFLAALGLPVAGSEAQLLLFDRLFTHFERSEGGGTPEGKLKNDLVRVHHILSNCTPRSIVILNEIFSSTGVKDGLQLGTETVTKLLSAGALSLFVTFLDELSALDPRVVSVVAGLAAADSDVRTFKIDRRAADGVAHALSIAEKYRLTHDSLLKRLNS
jgi:DNA mismatch repair ATPase MutS